MERHLYADGRIVTPYPQGDEKALLRAMPGARWDKDARCWRVSLANHDRPRLLELAQKLQLAVDESLLVVERSEEEESERARLAAAGLYPFQVDGALWLRARERGLLAHSMGLGKTVQVLMALPQSASVVVVCPATLKGNWKAECERWRPDLKPTVLKGRGKFRAPEPGEVVIVNYDILPRAPEERGARATVPIPGCYLVVDEASLCKRGRTQRAASVRVLAQSAARCWLLSGTPLENRPTDLWGVLRTGGLEREVFGGWMTFCQLYNATKNKWGGYVWGSPSPEVPERLRRVMNRLTKEEALPNLPACRYRHVPVDLEGESALIGVLDAMVDLWDGEGQADELPPFTEFSKVREQLARAKIPAMLDIVEQYEEVGEPLVVFSDHRAPIDELGKREGWITITGDTPAESRTTIVADFQAGKYKGIALTIAAGGYGLTLTHASHVLFVDRNWRPALNAQAQDRVRRIGTKAESILITYLVADHPLDRRVAELLDRKERLIWASIEATVTPTITAPMASAPTRVETEYEWQARVDQLREVERQLEVDAARRRRDARRLPGDAPLRLLDPVVQGEVIAAWTHLHGLCDGAQTKDGCGFSKPDASLSRAIAPIMDEPKTVLLCWETLRKYHQQLSGYPLLLESWKTS
jgi:hypothetical protein